jgi:DNA-binding CsgD family transcriptional regulator
MTYSNPLSAREQEVVKLLLQGKSNKMIASSLGISGRTVEFHLKNIYAKFQVGSRMELVLKLGHATGNGEIDRLWPSTVAGKGKIAENRARPGRRTDRSPSFRDALSITGKELEMQNLLNTRHVLVGVITALFTGFLWVSMLRYFARMDFSEILSWVVPLAVMLAVAGLTVGLVGKRSGSSLLKTSFSTLAGMGMSPVTVLPLMGLVVLPLGKLAIAVGLIDRAAMASDVATTIATIAMIVVWFVVGTATGMMLLFLSVKRPGQADIQTHASENGL